MSKEKRRVPKLRFPGFTEDWEQRKVNDLFKITRGQVLATSLTTPEKTSENIYPVYSSQTKNNGLMGYYSEYLFEDAITWTTDGANAGTVNFRPGRFYSTNVNGVLINENGYACYAVSEIINKVAYKYVSKVGNPKLMNNVMAEIDIMITPDIDELGRISALIEAYNQYITLHQRKLEHLNLKKKALLQKLFPKNGERYPELRFPGFTDAWEQRKADYIFKSITDKGYPELPVLSASQELGMVYRDQNGIDIQHDKKNETSYKRVLPGQFVIHLRSFQGGFAYSEVEGITSPAYTVMSLKNLSEQYGLFWKHVFKSETFIKRLETITYGIRDGRSISFSDFKSLILQYPSFSEQKLIGDSIAIIERGITLHQRKLDHLQLQKKALLQQMFV